MASQIVTIEVHWNEELRKRAEERKGGGHGVPGSWNFMRVLNGFLERRSHVEPYITEVNILSTSEVRQSAEEIQAEIESAT